MRRYQELDLGLHANGWVIHWEPGHDTGWHDHGGSEAKIIVISGVLVQDIRRYSSGMPSRQTNTLGQVITIHPECQHRVVPLVPCVAVHIYTPRLETMNLFDEAGVFVGVQDAKDELQAPA